MKKYTSKICRVENCQNEKKHKRSLCKFHYNRWNRYKSFEKPVKILPIGILMICKTHGNLTEKEIYIHNTTENSKIRKVSRCDYCRYESIIKANYGITKIQYEIMLKQQNGVCKICKLPEKCIHHKTKKIKQLAIDHCHKTGKIRGLLCNQCNRLLGYAKDSIELLESAIKYLKTTYQMILK
jgi:hypothetical protein